MLRWSFPGRSNVVYAPGQHITKLEVPSTLFFASGQAHERVTRKYLIPYLASAYAITIACCYEQSRRLLCSAN